MAQPCSLGWFMRPVLDLGPDPPLPDPGDATTALLRSLCERSSLTAELAMREQVIAKVNGWRTCPDCPARIKPNMERWPVL